VTDAPAPLTPDEAARLVDFARACKAATRAVTLYPSAHPAIAATLGRIVQTTSPASLPQPLRITVRPDSLLVDGRATPRADPAIGELAVLLHDHLVGELTVHPGGDLEAWRNFLLLLGRSPASVRTEGGIARVWTMMAGRHVELREIDYAEVLRERKRGQAADWDSVVANCLQGDSISLDEETIQALVEIAGDADKLAELVAALEARAGEGAGAAKKTAALLRVLQTIVSAVGKSNPDNVDAVLKNMAVAMGRVSADVMLGLLSHGGGVAGAAPDEEAPNIVSAVVSRMSESTIARFVAHNVVENTPIDRLAQAFQTLVRDGEQRERMLALARSDVAASPLGQTDGFEQAWNHVAEGLLKSYSDESYVSDSYGRELSRARAQAVQVEQTHDDPPERLTAWLSTIATSALRTLDLTLLLDLLRLEPDDEKWSALMTPVVSLLDDLLLVGDFEAASQLLQVLAREGAEGTTKERRQAAIIAIDRIVAGAMMHHVGTHLALIDDAQFEQVKTMCLSLGEVLVRPMAEALSTTENSRARERLTKILIGFGAIGRRTVERLKTSPKPAVRRTAVFLLRQFGGTEALPELTELLDDNETQVQREAIRAILNIGTETAYQVLEKALSSGTDRSRDAIMQSLTMFRDERAAPLFVYILRHVDHRGPLNSIYLKAIDSLGTLRDPESVEPLKEALYRGEWWAPRRTAALRTAAAAALARIATPQAIAVLEDAARSGPRGVRAAARASGVARGSPAAVKS
jgi:HEAT repeats/PBS lyase HEAT-like repeat